MGPPSAAVMAYAAQQRGGRQPTPESHLRYGRLRDASAEQRHGRRRQRYFRFAARARGGQRRRHADARST